MKKQLMDKFKAFLNAEKDENNPNLELNKEEVIAMSMLIIKADKWDKLDEKISRFYENEDSEGDICEIGLICAGQLGYL